MIYLARKNEQVIYHADKNAMMQMDGVSPEMEITEEEFYAADGLIRIINDKIFLGKTKKEKAIENAHNERNRIDANLVRLDSEYLTPRILAGAALGDEYSQKKIKEHDSLALPLREERKPYDELIKAAN